MSATSRKTGGTGLLDPEAVLLWIAIAVVAVVVGTLTAAVHVGIALDGTGRHVPANPFRLMLELANGQTAWPHGATAALIAIVALMSLTVAAGTVLYVRWRRGRSRVDRAARRMG